MQIIFWAILLYLLYRFITGFVLPVVKTARQVKRQFREMNRQASAFQTSQTDSDPTETRFSEPDHRERTTSGIKGAKEDYIDFEEIPPSRN